jgi:glycosyltransferase involved in cell wall biosynthesis
MLKIFSKLKNSSNKLKIIFPIVTEGVGYAKSAQRIQAELGKDKVDLIDLNRKGIFKKILICFLSKNIIINGYSALGFYQVILIVFFKKNINLYIHEGVEQVLKIEKKWSPLKKIYARSSLKKIKVFCVSYNQRRQLIGQSFLSEKSEVIYNCVGVNSSTLINTQPKRVKILMAGTLQDRKGARLFSEVADFISTSDLVCNFDFYWAGNKGNELVNLGKSVNFLGYIEDMSDLLENIDIFFLSSRDEPFGLSALEALQKGKKLVCYKDAGVSEVFDCVSGVEIFNVYSATSAIDALMRVHESELDVKKTIKITSELFSIESFTNNIKKKIGFPND